MLALFSLPLMLSYGIIPGETTPYWLFTIIFLVNLGFIIYAFINIAIQNTKPNRIVGFITPLVLVIIFGGIMWTQISNRGKNAPGQNMGTHDIVLQLEAALRYLSNGKNPYKETYFGTPMETWHYSDNKNDINPALYHFVMPPWYLEFAYPFYFVSTRTLGYFDARMPLLFCVFGIWIVLHYLFRNRTLARISMIMLVLAPLSSQYTIEGRSDMFALFWLLLSLLLLEKNRLFPSVIAAGLAVLSKQTVWFMLPLYLYYLFLKLGMKWGLIWKYIVAGGLVVSVCTVPFLVWDYRAFFYSVIFYLSGNTPFGYPVAGYGLGMLLYSFKVIKNIHDYYPFWVWQAGFGIPALILGAGYLRKNLSVSSLLFVHGISLFFIWYTSRYFNNSHILYIAGLLLLSVLKRFDELKNIYVQKQ
jgi:hypothetical protein